LPTTGTLATLAGSEALSNKTITASPISGSTGAFTTLNATTYAQATAGGNDAAKLYVSGTLSTLQLGSPTEAVSGLKYERSTGALSVFYGTQASQTNMAVFTSTGLGIGTASPQAKLQVTDQVKISDGTQGLGLLSLGDGLSALNNVGIWRGAVNSVVTGGNYLNVGGYDGIIFTQGNFALGSQTERARISSTGLAVTGALSSTTGATFATSSGNVGIGTTSPITRLHVSAAGFGAGNALFQSTNSANYITIRGVNGTGIYDSAFILFEDGTSSRDAFIGLTGDAATAGSLRFATNGNTERMRLNSTGLTLASLGTGLVYSNSGLLTSTNPSDARLKTDITDLGYGLSSILALRPVSYKWKSDTVNQGTQYGFIAQEVQTVMPDLVKEFETTEDGEKVTRLGLEKEGIYAALVKSVQELNANLVAQVEALSQRVAALESN
jgi:hypothetical protein